MSRANNNNHTYRQSAATSRPNLPAPRDTKLELSRLDAQIRHLIDSVLPKAPYLISVPSDVPYRHNSRFVNNWHLGTPFAREEEPLQYMSFLAHQDGEQGLIKAVGGWSDDQGNLVAEDPSPQQMYGSTANSPLWTGQRKKISLNDYKSKNKGGEESNRQGDMAQPDQNRSKSGEPGTNGVLTPSGAGTREIKAGSPAKKPQERKRSFDDVADASSKLKSSQPEKRARTRSLVRTKSPNSRPRNVDGNNVNNSCVPSLLSPTLPPSENVINIPELLSPTLPSSIEDLLARNEDEHDSSGKMTHRRSDSVRSLLSTVDLENSPKPAPMKAGMSRPGHERHLTPSLLVDLKEARTSPGARGRSSTSSPGPRQRHVIVLKYGKRNKKRVEALLKFAPRSKKQVPKAEPGVEDRNGVTGATDGAADGPQEKASIRDNDGPTSHPSELSTKRPKISPSSLNASERPTTPVPSAFKSPLIQNSLQSRSAFSTPKRELKTTAMRRVESSDGLDARTPSASLTRQSTPASTEKPQAASNRPSSPSDTNSVPPHRDDLRRAWRGVSVKYYDLGRTLKHEAKSLLQQETPDERKSVLLNVEALLCFMINQAALSYANNGNDPGWRTILPYLVLVTRLSTPFQHLHGLVSQLGAVCRQTIARHDLDRLSREPLPDDHVVGSAPTPGSDGNTKTSHDESDKARRRWNAFRGDLIDNARELQRAWLDGYQKLSPEILEQVFPDTWAWRARDSSMKAATVMGAEKSLSPENLGGRFFLPLDANTTPFEAVTYARRVLVEWAAREGKMGAPMCGWTARIEI